ncbi:hypothetical protein BU16DRAFT_566617 [Lophium mytilinum]|uniref:Uncharacterized protein n=1 Tax=Lophium mytilinum TaxID=390894 RepID=A0A6A6QDW5_9PEZI|nr:hypothetical protein BU16DRAFT_566617 [Lophium mytilinum]
MAPRKLLGTRPKPTVTAPVKLLEAEANKNSFYLHQWPYKSTLWRARWDTSPSVALNADMHIIVEKPNPDGPRQPTISVIFSTKTKQGDLEIAYKEEPAQKPVFELDPDKQTPAYIRAFNDAHMEPSTLAFATIWNDCGTDAESFGYRADGHHQGGCDSYWIRLQLYKILDQLVTKALQYGGDEATILKAFTWEMWPQWRIEDEGCGSVGAALYVKNNGEPKDMFYGSWEDGRGARMGERDEAVMLRHPPEEPLVREKGKPFMRPESYLDAFFCAKGNPPALADLWIACGAEAEALGYRPDGNHKESVDAVFLRLQLVRILDQLVEAAMQAGKDDNWIQESFAWEMFSRSRIDEYNRGCVASAIYERTYGRPEYGRFGPSELPSQEVRAWSTVCLDKRSHSFCDGEPGL